MRNSALAEASDGYALVSDRRHFVDMQSRSQSVVEATGSVSDSVTVLGVDDLAAVRVSAAGGVERLGQGLEFPDSASGLLEPGDVGVDVVEVTGEELAGGHAGSVAGVLRRSCCFCSGLVGVLGAAVVGAEATSRSWKAFSAWCS